jgi:hypothetical protein
VTQVFFSDDRQKPGWKVVLRKEAMARKEVVQTADVFITTSMESMGLIAPNEVPPPPNTASLLGAIELSAEDHLRAAAAY